MSKKVHGDGDQLARLVFREHKSPPVGSECEGCVFYSDYYCHDPADFQCQGGIIVLEDLDGQALD